MTAVDAIEFIIDEGALRIGRRDLKGIRDITDRENARAHDLLQHLHGIGRMSMRMVKKWAQRLELEDFVRYLLKKGVIGFAEACYFFTTEDDPTVIDLIFFLSDRQGNDDSFQISLFTHLVEFRAVEEQAAGKAAVAGGGEQKNGGSMKTKTGAKESSAKKA